MPMEREIKELRQDLQLIKGQVAHFEERLNKIERKVLEKRELQSPEPEMPKPVVPEAKPEKAISKPAPIPPPLPRHLTAKQNTPKPSETHEPKVAPLPKPRISEEPSTSSWLKNYLKRIGPDESLSWEMALGTYWLPRIGILVLAVGVVLLATLAVNRWGQEFLPHIRVATGFGIGAALLVVGRILEKRDSSYAQLLLSGGFAFCHFVTFAAHYIPYTQVIGSTTLTYAMLSAIVLAWGLYAQLRRSQLMGFMVTLLAHLTVAISTVMLEVPITASVAALIMLSLGSAFFMLYNRWYAIAAVGMLGSYGNQFLWFAQSPPSTEISALFMALGVASVYGLIYALAEFYSHEELRRSTVPTRLRSLYVTLNSGLFLGMSLLLMHGFDFSKDSTEYLYFSYALVSGALGIGYLKLRDRDPLYNAYLTKASVAVTLGLAATLDGAALSLSLALEALVLLVAARQSQLPMSRLLIQGTVFCTIAHGIYSVLQMPHIVYADPAYVQYLLPALGSVLVLFATSLLYQRTHWQVYLSHDRYKNASLRDFLQRCDVVDTPGEGENKSSFSALLWPTLFALGAAVLMCGYGYRLISLEHLPAALSLGALLVAGLGITLRSKPFTLASLVASFVAFATWHEYLQKVGAVDAGNSFYWNSILFGVLAFAPLMVLSECTRLLGKSRNLWLHVPLKASKQLTNQNALTYVYALAGAWLYVGVVLQHADKIWCGIFFCAAAAALTVYALFSGASALGLLSILLAIGGMLFTTVAVFDHAAWHYVAYPMIALAITALGCESRYVGERLGVHFHQLKNSPYLLYGMLAWLLYISVWEYTPDHNAMLWVTGLSIIALGLLRFLHPKALGLCATALLLGSTIMWIDTLADFQGADPKAWWHFCGVTACVVALGADRYFAWQKTFKRNLPGALLVTMAWTLLQYHTLCIEEWSYVGMAMLMIAFLGYGAVFRSRTAAALSLLGACMHSATLFLNTYGQQDIALATILLSFIGFVLYWLILERGAQYALRHAMFAKYAKELEKAAIVFGYVTSFMLLAMWLCVDMLPLTLEWTIAAIAMMGLGYLFNQRHYRYASLGTFGLVILRAFIVDTRNLAPELRIASMIVLGIVLLAVAFGYIQARNRQNKKKVQTALPPELPKASPETLTSGGDDSDKISD